MSKIDYYNPRVRPDELFNRALQQIRAHFLTVLSKFFVNENEVSVARLGKKMK